MAERLNATVLKTVVRESVPGVRIPPPPLSIVSEYAMPISTGNLLIAEPFMKDSNFRRSVILICDHNEEGTFGLNLNIPVRNITMGDIISDFPIPDLPVFEGGPVSPNTLHYIYKNDSIPDSIPIKDGIYWSGDFEIIKIYLESGKIKPNEIRFFIGYSGWGEGQLEDELKLNSWIVCDSYTDYLKDSIYLWKEILHHMGGNYKIVSSFPEDPTLN